MNGAAADELITQVWTGIAGEASLPAPLGVSGPPGLLPSRLRAEDAAVACVGVALMAAAALGRQRSGSVSAASVDRAAVAAAVRSERHFRVDGRPAGAGFAPLSRFWEAGDGWVRTHANYPWHRAALLAALGSSDDPDEVGAAIAALSAVAVEERVFGAGGIAAAVRTADEWRSHAQGAALAAEPLVGHERIGGAPARTRPPDGLPADGVQVLDLTRVIAGPVCTRFLGALGADVLRVDPPGHPDLPAGARADSLLAKRSAALDLGSAEALDRLHRLLEGADVVVCGYRPGALDRFGLGAADLAERHPGLVAVYVDAWGHSGPWSGRRGFDSVVQAPTGIAAAESPDGVAPGALPCQLLDHGTGYLAASAALDGLRRQGEEGGTHVRRLSLARTALWLTEAGSDGPRRAATEAEEPPLVRLAGGGVDVEAVAPPGRLGDAALRWPGPPARYLGDEPVWLSS
ncbi:MAG TPA: CoA transferase [Acidimicrobiales bacterium]|nr:CoA transferase [Acidimicrobiales bacterium]